MQQLISSVDEARRHDSTVSHILSLLFSFRLSKKAGLICILFLGLGKKLAYLVKYLWIYWTDFYKLFTIRKRFE